MSLILIIVAAILGLAESAQASELSIYEIQYTTDPNGTSPLHGTVVDCRGGIVLYKHEGSRPRLVLQDPNYPKGWGGIQVKGWSRDAFDAVAIGDWISFTNIEVEDYRGTTFLQFKDNAAFTIVSTNNPIPKPLSVRVSEVAAPAEGVDEWVVFDHSAEKYESMLIRVIDVTVMDRDYGKAYDNYMLESNVDPNQTCWASDYMNNDNEQIYHPYIQIGQDFCGVTGILEQYTDESDGIFYDYYQLLTRNTEDFVIYQTVDFDYDCDVDFTDFDIFAAHWQQTGCAEPDRCGGADLNADNATAVVNGFDFMIFAEHWLEGR